eukprot:2525763-Prymnesium_polylepis.1
MLSSRRRRAGRFDVLEGFPQLEGLMVSMADRNSGRRTHRGRATRAVRLSGITPCSVWSALQPWMAARARGVWAEPPTKKQNRRRRRTT